MNIFFAKFIYFVHILWATTMMNVVNTSVSGAYQFLLQRVTAHHNIKPFQAFVCTGRCTCCKTAVRHPGIFHQYYCLSGIWTLSWETHTVIRTLKDLACLSLKGTSCSNRWIRPLKILIFHHGHKTMFTTYKISFNTGCMCVNHVTTIPCRSVVSINMSCE